MIEQSVVETPSFRQKLWGWAADYAYVTYWMIRAAVGRDRPDVRLPPVSRPRSPVLLIPGVYESWRFMQPVADHLYRDGHPVHVLDKLGYNTGSIPDMARIVGDYLEREDLHDVTVIAHSKGGLIAKHAMGQSATLARVRRLISVNAPFSGSRYANLFLLPSMRMFAPSAPIIRALSLEMVVNRRISSLYSVFDPHIPETSQLDGAQNIILPTIGHFRPLGAPHTLRLFTAILDGPEPAPGERQERL